MAIITISRGTFSGGLALAEELSKRLGYKAFSREIIIDVSQKYGISEYKLFEAIQKGPSLFSRFFLYSFERECYLALITTALCERVKDDNAIYHGHAGHLLLPGVKHVLRIRIVANMEYRIGAAMQQRKLSHDNAIRYIQDVDKQRIRWNKFLYGVDWRSPEIYDMVFNIDRLQLECIPPIVERAIAMECFQATPESQQTLNNLHLASKVKATILIEHGVQATYINVSANDGVISISGKTKQQKELDETLKTAAKVPGVKEVRSEAEVDLRYLSVDL